MSKAAISRISAFTCALGSLGIASILLAGPASAATTIYLPDNCGYSDSEFFDSDDCYASLFLYYHQDGGGAMADFEDDVVNYSADSCGEYVCDYIFYPQAGTSTDGQNQGVRNDSGSADNTASQVTYTVFYYVDYSGHAQSFSPSSSTFINFDSTLHNANASQDWS